MKRTDSKSYMCNWELQSLRYWYKRAPLQKPLIKYNNLLKIMKNSVYKTDIINTSDPYFTNITWKPCINFHDRVNLRNIFIHWKVYVIHKLRTRRATYKADYVYHRKLQKKVLNALSKNVLLKWKHIVSSTDNCSDKFAISISYTKAEMHYAKIVARQYFARWCKYIALKRKKDVLLKTAIAFDNTHCLKKCMVHWKVYVAQQRRKQIMQDKVQKFYARNFLKKCIKEWMGVCGIISQRYQTETAILYYKQKLLKKSFNFWKLYHDFKVQKVNKTKSVQEYSRKKLLKQYFQQFVMRVNESIVDKTVLEKAEVFYNFSCLRRVFSEWVEWYNTRVQDSIKITEFRSILESKQKSTIFSNWRLYVYEKKWKQRKIYSSQHFYEEKLMASVLRKLRNYTFYRKQKKRNSSCLKDESKIIIQQLQIIFIEKWKSALYITVQEERKLNQAIKFRERNLTRKYLLFWKEYSQQYKVKIFHKEKLYELASSLLLKKYILHWHAKLQDILDIHKKEALAITMMNYKIMKKYFLSWKHYITQKMRIKNNIETAKELHKKLLLHEGLKEILRNCLCNIDYKHGMQLEDATMKSFKNFEILKEYFTKWHSLIYLKNVSKSIDVITEDNNLQFMHSETSNDCTFNNMKNTNLVVPEYIKKRDSISNISNLFLTFPMENWPFNCP